jgi:Glyoxalase/Bleomycin resistance protein/Dioxygenase superfamily
VRGVLGPAVQLAFTVDDVRRAARAHHHTFGSGPFFVIDHIALESATCRGVTTTFDHSSAYGQWGDVMVELVCVHEGTSPVLRAAMATTGMHHSAHVVDDIDAALEAIGATIELDATTTGGMRFVMCAPTPSTGCLIELYQPTLRLKGFYAMVATAALDWDGRDVVREM